MKKWMAGLLVLILICATAFAETRTSTLELEGQTCEVNEERVQLDAYAFWYDSDMFGLTKSDESHVIIAPLNADVTDVRLRFSLTGKDPETASAEKRSNMEAAGWVLTRDFEMDETEGGILFDAIYGMLDGKVQIWLYTDGAEFEINCPEDAVEGFGTRLMAAADTLSYDDAEFPEDESASGEEDELISLPWAGAVLVGTLPKEAELIDALEDEYGYAQTLFYDGIVSIVSGRFASDAERKAFVESRYPVNGEVEVRDDYPIVAGCEATHRYYVSGSNEDSGAVDVIEFDSGDNCFLFLTYIPLDWYEGVGDDEGYRDFLPAWIESLEIMEP